MIKMLLLCVLLSAAAFSSGCQIASAENTGAETGKTPIQAVPATTPRANKSAAPTGQSKTSRRTARFKNVSFNYNPQIFGEGVPEEVAEQMLERETDKPDDIHPRHIRFTFRKRNQGKVYSIAVFPIEDYRRIWKNAGEGNRAAI